VTKNLLTLIGLLLVSLTNFISCDKKTTVSTDNAENQTINDSTM